MKTLKWILLLFLVFIFNFEIQSSYKENKDTKVFMQTIKSSFDSTSNSTIEIINLFNEAFNNHDVDAVMKLMTEDCVFENTRPAPDGERIVGQEKVRAFWEMFFNRSPKAHFETEEIFAVGDRCIVRWIYTWIKDGKEGHIRGVDIFKVRDGKVAEKFSYVKG